MSQSGSDNACCPSAVTYHISKSHGDQNLDDSPHKRRQWQRCFQQNSSRLDKLSSNQSPVGHNDASHIDSCDLSSPISASIPENCNNGSKNSSNRKCGSSSRSFLKVHSTSSSFMQSPARAVGGVDTDISNKCNFPAASGSDQTSAAKSRLSSSMGASLSR